MPQRQLTWPPDEVKKWLASRPETMSAIADSFGVSRRMFSNYVKYGAPEYVHRMAAMYDTLHPRRQVRLDYLSPEDRAKAID